MWQLLEENIPGFGDVSKTTWLVFFVVVAVLCLLNIIAFWRLFEKAGEKGWKSLIPVYNVYIMFKIAWSPKAFLNVLLISLISGLNEYMMPTAEGAMKTILSLTSSLAVIYAGVIMIWMSIRLSKAFGHGVLFGLGLYFFEVPFIMVLGLGKSQYTRPAPDPNFEDPHTLKN